MAAAATATAAATGMAVEAGLRRFGFCDLIVEVGHRAGNALQRVAVLDFAVRTPLGDSMRGINARRDDYGADRCERDHHATCGGEDQPTLDPNGFHHH